MHGLAFPGRRRETNVRRGEETAAANARREEIRPLRPAVDVRCCSRMFASLAVSADLAHLRLILPLKVGRD